MGYKEMRLMREQLHARHTDVRSGDVVEAGHPRPRGWPARVAAGVGIVGPAADVRPARGVGSKGHQPLPLLRACRLVETHAGVPKRVLARDTQRTSLGVGSGGEIPNWARATGC